MAQQKYSIVNKLDAGGMAEVWKGKATSFKGFEKLVAIKRVLPELAKKKSFIDMFLDEARLSLHLNHANVVQTFDIGKSDDAYFIVMEWVDGMNLKGILDSVKLSGDRVPLEQAVFISAEVCKGLHHAHRRKTPDGTPLNIVHRDISPPNLLISREGEVKLVDFGLAKAATQALPTDQGMIKGKFSYLSPEAAWGQPVDERADIFAVGALIWEMLAGRRLFEGASDRDTVLMIRDANVPSLESFNPYVDQELMQIIWRALARDLNDRYPTAKELGQDLTAYLFKHQLTVSNFDIAELVEKTIHEREKDKRLEPEWFDELGQVEEQLIQFTSLEDLHHIQQMIFHPVSEQGDHKELGLMHGEDPRGWVEELGVSFTPPPVQSAQVDLSAGSGRAENAFTLRPNETPTHQAQPNASSPHEAHPSASAQPASARREESRPEPQRAPSLLKRALLGLLYVIIAILIIVGGLMFGVYLGGSGGGAQQQGQQQGQQRPQVERAVEPSNDPSNDPSAPNQEEEDFNFESEVIIEE